MSLPPLVRPCAALVRPLHRPSPAAGRSTTAVQDAARRAVRRAGPLPCDRATSRPPTGPSTSARRPVASPVHWRIRLVAYGARLESGLGATPREFESPILRRYSPATAASTSTPPASAPGESRSPRNAVASAVAVSGSSSVTIEATAPGTLRIPVKNSPYASALGTAPR